MIFNRIAKWSAAAALAAGTIPAIGLAKSHVSLPTSNITVTPTSAMESPAARTSARVTRVKSAAKVTKASSTKHRTARHSKGSASHHKKGTSASLKKKPGAAHVKKAAATKSHKSAHKVVRVG